VVGSSLVDNDSTKNRRGFLERRRSGVDFRFEPSKDAEILPVSISKNWPVLVFDILWNSFEVTGWSR